MGKTAQMPPGLASITERKVTRMYEDFKSSYDNQNGNSQFHNQNGGYPTEPVSGGYAAPSEPAAPRSAASSGYQPDFTLSAPPTPPTPPPYNSVPGWGAAPSPKPPKPKKPKKNHRFLKFAATAVAVMVFAFGFGYWGSQVAISQNENFLAASSNPVSSSPASSETSSGGSANSSNTGLWTGTTEEDYTVVEKVAAIAANSVVEITTEGLTTDSYFQQRIVSGAGSGVIISTDGIIVTNDHVVQGADKITVTLRDGTQYNGTLVGTDAKSDLAVVKVDATGLQAAVMGSSASLKVGELAVAIGNPLGQLGGTVTNGIISALDREITVQGETMTLLQTNAAINPGNSGGGLFNSKGELIGIVNAKSGGTENGTTIEGLGFAIPIDTAKGIIDDLTSYGYVRGRIDIGMTFLDVSDPITAMMYRLNGTGVYVASVTDGSSAAKTGIREGDCIVSIDGQEVRSSNEIKQILNNHSVGDTISIVVSRNGRTGEGSITLEEYTGGAASGVL